MAQKVFEASISGGDRVSLSVDIEKGNIRSAVWNIIGRVELLADAKKIKDQVQGDVGKIPVPRGTSPSQLLLKQLILKRRSSLFKIIL